MPIFSGTIKYKGNSNHKAGETRELTAGVNDAQFARIFGVDNTLKQPSNSGQIAVIDLEKQETIYISENEMTRIDELTYLRKHTSEITSWFLAGNYLWTKHRDEMLGLYHRIMHDGEPKNMLDNKELEILVQAYLGAMDEKSANAFLRVNKTDYGDEPAFVDTISRHVRPKYFTRELTVRGIQLKPIIKVVSVEADKDTKRVNVKTKIILEANDIVGSVGALKKKFEKQKKAFQTFKNTVVPNVLGRMGEETTAYELRMEDNNDRIPASAFTHLDADMDDHAADTFKTLQEALTSEMDNYFADDDDMPKINLATAFSKIWEELGLQAGDMSRSGLNDDALVAYANGEISAKEYMNINKDAFIKKFQKVLSERFSKYASPEAFANRALEIYADDLHITDLNRAEWQSKVQAIAEQVLSSYAEGFKQNTNLSELQTAYSEDNNAHDQAIMTAIKEAMANQFDLAKEADKKTIDKIFNQLGTALYDHAEEVYADYKLDKGIPVEGDDQFLFSDFVDQNAEQLWLEYCDQFGYEDANANIEKFVNSLDDRMKAFFDENFDWAKLNNKLMMNLVQGLSMPPYNKVPFNKWLDLLKEKIGNDFNKLLEYGSEGNNGVEKFAEDFGQNLMQSKDEKAIKDAALAAFESYLTESSVTLADFTQTTGMSLEGAVEEALNKHADVIDASEDFAKEIQSNDAMQNDLFEEFIQRYEDIAEEQAMQDGADAEEVPEDVQRNYLLTQLSDTLDDMLSANQNMPELFKPANGASADAVLEAEADRLLEESGADVLEWYKNRTFDAKKAQPILQGYVNKIEDYANEKAVEKLKEGGFEPKLAAVAHYPADTMALANGRMEADAFAEAHPDAVGKE